MMRLVWLVVAVLWLSFLVWGVGPVPALGPILDFQNGIWHSQSARWEDGILPGLSAPVQVSFDNSGVPHLFAENEADLYRAQGYLMAAQRLFQMDLSSRVVAGEISDLVGARALEMDRYFVQFGMRESVRRDLQRYLDDPQSRMILEAFVQGVNTYIDQATRPPPEYLLLGSKPKRFEPIHVLYMAKLLTYNLAARTHDLLLTEIQQNLGASKVLDLFPEFFPSRYEDYIFMNTSGEPRRREKPDLFNFVSGLKQIPRYPFANPANGSNNWAVGPKRSASGYAMMANDTHLGLSLPNVWYENQLSTPQFNVYGVSLNAVPGIVLGFNPNVAWATTNGTTDVLDFFEIEFENAQSNRYRSGDQWFDAEVRVEVIGIKGARSENQTVTKTRHGYLLHREGSLGLVADWLPHSTSGIELKALRGLFPVKNYSECLEALKYWQAPIQNFLCVDKHNISLEHIGRIPRRRIGQGRFVMDGREKNKPLNEAPTVQSNPRMVNPPSGYVHSANQKVQGPRGDEYWGWDYEQPFRGQSIRRLLESKSQFTPEDFLAMQNDSDDMGARLLLPLMIGLMGDLDQRLASEKKEALLGLKNWDFKMKAEAWEPVLYKEWLSQVRRRAFESDYRGRDWLYPPDVRLAIELERAQQPSGELQNVVRASYEDAWNTLTSDFGPDFHKWQWSQRMLPELRHVARIPGLGTRVTRMDGASTSVRGISRHHGPVYKLVVAFGERAPEAWIQMPGHNEGNPFVPDFEKHVEDWARGEMRKVEFFEDKEQARLRAAKTINWRPKEI